MIQIFTKNIYPPQLMEPFPICTMDSNERKLQKGWFRLDIKKKKNPQTEDNYVLEKITENISVLFWTTKKNNKLI